jgi:hypothetical protein
MRGRSVSALALSDSLLEGFHEGHALYQGTTSVVPQMCREKIGLQPLGGGSPRIHAWEKSASALALSDSPLEGFDEGHALYQGTTSVVPQMCPEKIGLQPLGGGSPRIHAGEGALQRSGKSTDQTMRFSAGPKAGHSY